MKKYLNNLIFPLTAAIIWGISFPAQAICIKYMTAFWINGSRSILAALILLGLCFVRKRRYNYEIGKTSDLIKGSLTCGVLLFTAINLQQIGIADTASGKAGFITALYTVLVPVIGIFLGRKVAAKTWVAIGIAVIGLYFLCIKGDFTVEKGDGLLMACAVFFSVQMVMLSIFTAKVDPISLSCGQFFVTGILSLIFAFIFEDASAQNIGACIMPLLYIAVFSSCIGYTLQVVSFKTGNPAILSLLFSLESVFAVLAGTVILDERLSSREIIGCAIMFAAVILAELPGKKQTAQG